MNFWWSSNALCCKVRLPGILALISMLFVCGMQNKEPQQAPNLQADNKPTIKPLDLKELPSFFDGYRVDPYINAAIHFQTIGHDAALAELYSLANGCTLVEAQKIIVLCSMLYSPRKNDAFENAPVGGPGYFGESRGDNFRGTSRGFTVWKRTPVEVVSGVPFAVISGYSYQGGWNPDVVKLYLRHCEKSCDWDTNKYSVKTASEKERAMEALSNSTNWSVSPKIARHFLELQIK